MSEQKMTEENKKTIVAFISGLLIGGLLVFIFANPADRATNQASDNTAEGTSKEVAKDAEEGVSSEGVIMREANEDSETTTTSQSAGNTVSLGNVSFPADAGWVGIRDYEGGQLTGLLGVARWNKEEGLLPAEVPVLRQTVSGKTYAIVFYSDNGDKRFDLATDAQLEGELTTFVAK